MGGADVRREARGGWPPDPLYQPARGYALAVAVIATLVLLGWLLNIDALTSLQPGWPPMVPNTAFGMLLAASALYLLTRGPRAEWAARALGSVLVLGGGLILAEFLLGRDFGQRYWVFREQLLHHEVDRVAFGTGLNFVLVGLVILLYRFRRGQALSEALLHVIGLMAVLRFIGYPFGIAIFKSLGGFKTMAIPTSACFVLLWLGLACARGRAGALRVLLDNHVGGRLARWLLPTVIAVQLLIGWLRQQGERAGLFDSAEGTTLVATIMCVLLSAIVLSAAALFNQADHRREEQEAALRSSEARLKRLFDSPMLGVFTWNRDGWVTDANDQFLQLLGFTRADVESGGMSWTKELAGLRGQSVAQDSETVPSHEVELTRSDGTLLPVMLGAVYPDSELEEGIGFIVDNSDRHRAQEQIEERNAELEQLNDELALSEERLRRVIDSPLIGITFWRLQDGVPALTDANQRFLDMLGYTRDELAAGRLSWEAISTPEEEQTLRERNNAEFAATRRIAPYEREYVRADGSRLPVLVGAVLIDERTQAGVSFVLDMTEQRSQRAQIEERNAELEQLSATLGHKEARLRAVFESSLVGMFYWQLDGTITEANGRFSQLTGYSAADIATGRLSYDQLAGAANSAATQARRRAVMEHGELTPTEVLITRADGGRLPIVIASMLLDRQARQGVSLFLDASEQHTARAMIEERNAELEQLYDELATSENRLRRVFESPLMGMVLWRMDGTILGANRRFFDLVGYKPSDIGTGRLTWNALLPPEPEEVRDEFRRELLASGEIVPQERELIHAEGSRVPVLFGSALFDTMAQEGVTYVMDISEQRRQRDLIEERNAELEQLYAELARGEQRLRAVFDSPLSAMAFSSAAGQITAANSRFFELTGVAPEKLLNGGVTWMDLTPPELRERSQQQGSRLATQDVIVPEEDILYRVDGTRLPVLAGGARLPGAEREWVAFLLDRSEQARQREIIEERNAELEQLNSELESRTGEVERLAEDLQSRNVLLEQLREAAQQANVQLSLANADLSGQNNRLAELEQEARLAATQLETRASELQRINAELDSFSYSVSHDLRAPLRAIEGFSKALEEDYAEQLDDDAKRYISRIRAGTLRMAQLIDDLLQLSRVSRVELSLGRVDMSELARMVAGQLQDSDPPRQVEWDIQSGLEAEGDGRLLRIVLENLMGNAFKFTAKRSPARISFTASDTARGRAYCIRDNGAGFDMAYASKLFTAFQRLHSVEEFAGTGIGLSIVRRIISRHNGEIWAESQLEQGAAFSFTLQPPGQEDAA